MAKLEIGISLKNMLKKLMGLHCLENDDLCLGPNQIPNSIACWSDAVDGEIAKITSLFKNGSKKYRGPNDQLL